MTSGRTWKVKSTDRAKELGPFAEALGFDEICDAHRAVYNKSSWGSLTDRAWAGLTALQSVVDRPVWMNYICSRHIPDEVAQIVLSERDNLLGG